MTTTTNTDEDIHSNAVLGQNTWYHLVAVRDGTTQAIYINGQLDASRTCSPDPIKFIGGYDDDTVHIGAVRRAGYTAPKYYLNGIIDEVAIYNRALSAEEIQQLTHTRPDTDEPNLVGYWDFDEGEGQIAEDSSGNGNNGTLGSTEEVDNSDPNWVDSDAPAGICSLERLVERNLLNVLGIKQGILDDLERALGKENALWEYMDIVFENRDFGNTSKGDVVKAKQKIHSAMQQKEQAETSIEASIEKLKDGMIALDIESNSNGL